MPRAAVTLKAKALAYIAQREHSRVELRRKLLSFLARQARAAAANDTPAAAPPDAAADEPSAEQRVDELLDWLAAKDLLSTERFVETRVQARVARFGTLRIRQELARHGVELDAATREQLAASELARARAVWTKRFGVAPADLAERARQARFLGARGFGPEVVRRVLQDDGDDG